MGKCSWTGFVRAVKQVITFVFSHVGLCAFVAGYSVAGAFLFRQLEQDKVDEYYDSTINRNDCFGKLYNITEEVGVQLNGSHWRDLLASAAWQERVLQQLEAFEEDLVESVRNQTYDQGPEEQKKRWSVIGSLFYCVTVITTIGYGHVSPRTNTGKMVTIVYALFGIPLMLLCLTNIGNSMATSFRFMYHRMCCWYCRKKKDEDGAESSSMLQNPRSWHGGTSHPCPYTPPPKYKPNRRNMLISPPISATIHRGSDNPLKAPSLDSPSPSPGPPATRALPFPSQTHVLLPDMEANRIVAECAAYTKTHIPGFVVSLDPASSDCHDYDMVTVSTRLSPSVSTRPSPTASSRPTPEPSSPRARETPAEWALARENGGPHIVIESEMEQPSSNHSTRPGSPTFTTSTHHASNTSLTSIASRPCNQRTSSPFLGATLSGVRDLDAPPYHRVVERPPRSPGKTLVVYNTLSGDALLEQSKIVRKMALMNKGGFGQVRTDATTVFTDPISGQAVDGDMLGLNYRPIPPDTSDAENRVPIPIVLGFVASYLGIGSLLFVWLEGWSMLDACYFCFITLSTIGFGDFVPGKSLGYETQEAQIKLVTGSIYLVLGLAVLAMSFNLVQEEVVLKCKAFANWIGLLKD
nr:uncharacterized protein LOC113805849 [Penaeus vannamei]